MRKGKSVVKPEKKLEIIRDSASDFTVLQFRTGHVLKEDNFVNSVFLFQQCKFLMC